MTRKNQITVKQLLSEIPNLKVTDRQREFIKAAFRACFKSALEKKFKCKVSI